MQILHHGQGSTRTQNMRVSLSVMHTCFIFYLHKLHVGIEPLFNGS